MNQETTNLLEQADLSADLLYLMAEEADEICPRLSEPALIMAHKALMERPTFARALSLNRLMMYRGAFYSAYRVLEEMKDLFDAAKEPEVKAECYLYLGDAYFRSGLLDKAEAAIKASLEAKPDNEVAHLLAGLLYQVKLDYPTSQQALERSLSLRYTEIAHKFLGRTVVAHSLLTDEI